MKGGGLAVTRHGGRGHAVTRHGVDTAAKAAVDMHARAHKKELRDGSLPAACAA